MSKKYDEKWGPHSHCLVCGNAIPDGEKTCSEECKAKLDLDQKKYKRNQKLSYIFIGLTGAVIIILFAASYFFK